MELYKARHRVYVDELGVLPPQAFGMVRDRFDSFDETLNLIAIVGGRIVGGTRFVHDVGRGTPVDRYFGFSDHLPDDAVVAAGSMLWVLPEARGRSDLVPPLMGAGLRWCIQRGVSHVLGAVNPLQARNFRDAGYRVLHRAFVHEETGLPILPIVLELGNERRRDSGRPIGATVSCGELPLTKEVCP